MASKDIDEARVWSLLKQRGLDSLDEAEDLQYMFREFFFKIKIKNEEKFSDWLLRFELLGKKVTIFKVVIPPHCWDGG